MFSILKKPEKKAVCMVEQNKMALSRLLENSGISVEKTLDQILKDLEKQGIIKS